MIAAQIINQIQSLPSEKRAGAIHFVCQLEAERKLSGTEFSVLAERFGNAADPTEMRCIREQIVSGFHGGKSNA
jgi:hypothetical protein